MRTCSNGRCVYATLHIAFLQDNSTFLGSKIWHLLDDRCVLGGHVAHLKSPIIYSRDALARPLYVLGSVLDAIRLGEFLPDRTRSGRFVEPERSGNIHTVEEFEPVNRDEQGSPIFLDGPSFGSPTKSPGPDLFGGSGVYALQGDEPPYHEVGKEPSRLHDPGVEMLDVAYDFFGVRGGCS